MLISALRSPTLTALEVFQQLHVLPSKAAQRYSSNVAVHVERGRSASRIRPY